MSVRPRTTSDEKEQYRTLLREQVNLRIDESEQLGPNATDDEICTKYETLTHTQKRGIWPAVSKQMGKYRTWAAKHYSNAFKRAMYHEQITVEDKMWIHEFITRQLASGMMRDDINTAVKEKFAGRNVYPEALQSFVIQTFIRLRKNPTAPFVPQRAWNMSSTILHMQRAEEQRYENVVDSLATIYSMLDALKKIDPDLIVANQDLQGEML